MSVFDNMQDYILARITLDPGSGCWLWEGQISRHGYGQFRRHSKETWRKAHRESYESFIGPIADELCVLHTCDTPACCNPKHLFLGTQVDNLRDMRLKNRHSRRGSPKEFCIRGHRLIPENKNSGGCIECGRIRIRQWRELHCPR